MDVALNALIQFVTSPAFKLVMKWLLAYWILSAAIGHLPMPTPKAPYWYRAYIFPFLNGFAANINRAARSLKVPGAPPENQL